MDTHQVVDGGVGVRAHVQRRVEEGAQPINKVSGLEIRLLRAATEECRG